LNLLRVLGAAALVLAITLAATARRADACEAKKASTATASAKAESYSPIQFSIAEVLPILQPLAPFASADLGMIAILDPETGTIGGPVSISLPTTGETQDPSIGLVIEPALSGIMMDLKGRYQEYATVHLDALGRVHLSCGPDHNHDLVIKSAPGAVEE
jgi:hypothetical protein